jgi:hypothetical protein
MNKPFSLAQYQRHAAHLPPAPPGHDALPSNLTHQSPHPSLTSQPHSYASYPLF